MVGVVTSNRCDTCRKRKKKCDEKKPACSQCIRGGWECPGYPSHWKFVNEVPKLAEHYASKKFVYESNTWIEEVQFTSFPDEKDISVNNSFIWDTHSNISAKLKVPRFIDLNPLATQFTFCLECPVKGDLMPLFLAGSFTRLIPARLGCNAALDDAVSCICSIYCHAPSTAYRADKEVFRKYNLALTSLRQFLGNDDTNMASETLCASVLLQMCELAVNVDRGEWSQLTLGTASLFASRGLHRYKSVFEKAILHSQLSYIIGHSLRTKEPCFLKTKEWQALLAEDSDWATIDPNGHTFLLKSKVCAVLVHMPSLLALFSDFLKLQPSDQNFIAVSELILHDASVIIKGLQKFLTIAFEPRFVAQTLSTQSIQSQLRYENVVLGVLDCVSNTGLVTLDRIVDDITEPKEMIEERRVRALSAFQYVCGESRFAAKPLEFGIHQMQAGGLHS
ncbi:hypothetical protein BGZ60DRAFT_502581 [Tricladium varicosporioides]|nr:hypothetical protein BGZ60DRAFT_502581 [Hymenoscyphus varicosporioides]